jgi:hypothetical protein
LHYAPQWLSLVVNLGLSTLQPQHPLPVTTSIIPKLIVQNLTTLENIQKPEKQHLPACTLHFAKSAANCIQVLPCRYNSVPERMLYMSASHSHVKYIRVTKLKWITGNIYTHCASSVNDALYKLLADVHCGVPYNEMACQRHGVCCAPPHLRDTCCDVEHIFWRNYAAFWELDIQGTCTTLPGIQHCEKL